MRTITAPEVRFWAKVRRGGPDECWPWTNGKISSGYGGFHPVKGQLVLAHRWAYETEVGPIPPGMVVDHLCHNETSCPGGRDCPHRACCNPAHLGIKTDQGNLRAGPNHNSKRTHCPRGHQYTPENTRIQAPARPGLQPRRSCRTCAREMDWTPKRADQQRRRRAAKKQEEI